MIVEVSLGAFEKATLAVFCVALLATVVWHLAFLPWRAGRRWLHAHAANLGVSWSWFERASTIRARLRETWLCWSSGTVITLERVVAAVPGVSRVDVREDHEGRRIVVRIKRRWFTRRQRVLDRVTGVVHMNRPLFVRCDVEEG
jgi:hypothetical protein